MVLLREIKFQRFKFQKLEISESVLVLVTFTTMYALQLSTVLLKEHMKIILDIKKLIKVTGMVFYFGKLIIYKKNVDMFRNFSLETYL